MTSAPVSADGRVQRGEHTRAAILARAVDLASIEGLDGLSIGRLARELGVSKSGLFAHFGSKEALQLATVAAAVDRFVAEVVRPILDEPAGMGRLKRLCDSWLAYSRSRIFPGGCFFYGASAEFDAKPGPVRDALATAQAAWSAFVVRTIDGARSTGELTADTDPEQLGFEIRAVLEAANLVSVLHDDDSGYARARAAISSRLASASATGSPTVPPTG